MSKVDTPIRGLLLAAGSGGVLRVAAAGMLAVLAAGIVILRPKEYGLYAIGPVSVAVLFAFSGFAAMRRRRILLHLCAETIAERKQIRFLELRNTAGASVHEIKRTLATLRDSHIVPPDLLEAEVRQGRLLEKRSSESSPGSAR